MFKKLIIGVVFIFALTPLFLPLLTNADGMLIAPSDRYIFESDQRGVIFFEDGQETLILSTKFQGDANDFAWIVPSPAKPEVTKASAEIFTSLESLTGSTRNFEVPTASSGFGLGASMDKGVQVIEEKSIEYYDIAVLASDDKTALADWLNKNGYHFPEQYSYVLQSYIDNGWIFTAVKFKNDINSQTLIGSMRDGNLIPLQFKFKTDNPVYPLKISSIIEEPNSANDEPNYVTTNNNYALQLSKSETLYTLNQNYNIQKGSFEIWVKIDQVANEQANSSLFTINDRAGSNKLRFSVQGGSLNLQLYDRNNINMNPMIWSAGSNLQFGTGWNYVAVTWNPGETPKFFFNGPISAYQNNLVYPAMNTASLSNDIYIGNDQTVMPIKNISVDQVKLSTDVRTDQEMLDNYNNGNGRELPYDANTFLVSSFNKNFRYIGLNEASSGFVLSNTNPRPINNSNNYKPYQVGIELYVFTPDKEQTLPGFNTAYAAWTNKKTIENLAMDDNGKSFLEVKKDKYYLTKLTRQMKYEEMNNDLFFRNAATNSDTTTEKSKISFYILLSMAGLSSLIICAFIIKINKN